MFPPLDFLALPPQALLPSPPATPVTHHSICWHPPASPPASPAAPRLQLLPQTCRGFLSPTVPAAERNPQS